MLDNLNRSFGQFNISYIKKHRIENETYAAKKLEEITEGLRQLVLKCPNENRSSDQDEWLDQLKAKFSTCSDYDEKVFFLTTLQKRWSITRKGV